ncbi:MAG: methyltransferase domain-containing protein [Thermoanaerobaculia bacterium]
MGGFSCRFCGAPLTETVADLGLSPPANAYVPLEKAHLPEAFYPLHVYVCGSCFLVQLPEVLRPEEIFSDYAYFSSYSRTWLEHARNYVESMIDRFGFDAGSQVVEVASNDGYLLRFFRDRGVPVLGIEPAANVAHAAQEAGIPTRVCFFGEDTARRLVAEGARADLLLGNNVLAHVPDLNGFVAGLKVLLAEHGVLTMEFPHLMRLIDGNEFDTIYHEHYSYLALGAVRRVFEHHGLELFDVEELRTHGGSLRVYARHAGEDAAGDSVAGRQRVAELLAREDAFGLADLSTYRAFGDRVRATKRKLLSFLVDAKAEGKRIVGYGAPAKGNTLLNYCGIGHDFLDYTVDLSPHKQGHLLPGTRIPIHPPERIFETRPHFILILPWNLKDEIVEQLAGVREWGGRFVVAIPEVQVLA